MAPPWINLLGVASDKLPLLLAISRKFVLDTGDVSGAWVHMVHTHGFLVMCGTLWC